MAPSEEEKTGGSYRPHRGRQRRRFPRRSAPLLREKRVRAAFPEKKGGGGTQGLYLPSVMKRDRFKAATQTHRNDFHLRRQKRGEGGKKRQP